MSDSDTVRVEYCVVELGSVRGNVVYSGLREVLAEKNKHLGKREDKDHRRDWTSQKTEVDLGKARQQDTR